MCVVSTVIWDHLCLEYASRLFPYRWLLTISVFPVTDISVKYFKWFLTAICAQRVALVRYVFKEACSLAEVMGESGLLHKKEERAVFMLLIFNSLTTIFLLISLFKMQS